MYVLLTTLHSYMAMHIVPCHWFIQVAMGQGQATVAIQLLRECASKGHWLCLKNLHLVTSWLPTLEKVHMYLSLINTLSSYNKYHIRMYVYTQVCMHNSVI